MITTRLRATVGRLLYHLATLGGKSKRIVVRGGITYEVDLAEGLDLSLYLFGSFQKHVTGNRWVTLTDDALVLDVGANFGVMALAFAKAFPKGRVIAFEPTHYALGRLAEPRAEPRSGCESGDGSGICLRASQVERRSCRIRFVAG